MADDTGVLAILGSYPPPMGGVSVHVQRLCALLRQRGVKYAVYNATSDVGDGKCIIPVYRNRRWWLLKYLFTGKEPAAYILSGRLSAWIIGALMASWRGKRVMLRLRNASLIDWAARSWWLRLLCRFALRRLNGIVCVNRALVESAKSLGVKPELVHWSSGFLPPEVDGDQRNSVPPAVWEFTKTHEPIIAANGKVNWYKGQDLYGLDHLVELAARIKPDYPNIGIVVCFWDHWPRDQAYLDALISTAAEKGVSQNILLTRRAGHSCPFSGARISLFDRRIQTGTPTLCARASTSAFLPSPAMPWNVPRGRFSFVPAT